MNDKSSANGTPPTENDNVCLRSYVSNRSSADRLAPCTSSTTSGVLGNTNRRYYSNISTNSNATLRPFALVKPSRLESNRLASLPNKELSNSNLSSKRAQFKEQKSKRSSPLPKLLKLVSKSSDYLERKFHSSHSRPTPIASAAIETGSANELLEAANLRPDQNKPLRNVRKRSLEVQSNSVFTTDIHFNSPPLVSNLSSRNLQTIETTDESIVVDSAPKPSNGFSSENKQMRSQVDFIDDENKIETNLFDRRQRIMNSIRTLLRQQGRQIAIAAVLLFSIWNAFGTERMLKTRSPATPTKFFHNESQIIDFELGDLSQLSQLAGQREATFVVYYAPWDAGCQRFRREYEIVSKHFADQMLFVAINCWWQDGECGKSFKIKRYPVLLAYLRGIGEVEYRGPLVSSYLLAFIDHLLNPLERLVSVSDLSLLRAKHDGIVLGYFDFERSPNPPGYQHFLQAAVKSLHIDPWKRVQFAIVSNWALAEKLHFEKPQQIQIFTWNDSVIYGGQVSKTDTLIKWIFDIVFDLNPTLVEWVTPLGLKSDNLANRLAKGPTLLLFTPRSLVLGISPYFEVLREVAMDYFDCDNSPSIKAIAHQSILRRKSKEERLVELEEKCHELQQSNEIELKEKFLPKDIARDDRCCYSQLIKWKSASSRVEPHCYCTSCVNVNSKTCPGNCKRFNCLATASRYLNNFEPIYINASASQCNQIRSSYLPKFTPYFDIQIKCHDLSAEAIDFLQQKAAHQDEPIKSKSEVHSDREMSLMLKTLEQEHCQRFRLGLSYSDLNFPDTHDVNLNQKWRENFTGSGCRTSKPLQFLAIDSIQFPAFTENLGIDVFNETHATVAMIIEPENETSYLLNEKLHNLKSFQSIGKQHLYQFIRDFSDRKLNRYVRSKSADRVSSQSNCKSKRNSDGSQTLCVPEITTHSFAEVALDVNRDVVLMYYTPWCGFCSSVAHTYLTVARFFVDIPQVTFARINADANELPFEYSVDRFPAIVFYPANRKQDHVVYPINMPITTTGLIQFVLANSADLIKWQAALKFCNRDCLQRNLLDYTLKLSQLERQLILLQDQFANATGPTKNLLEKQIGKGRQAIDAVSTLKELITNKLRLDSTDNLPINLNDHLHEDMMNIVNLDPLQSNLNEIQIDVDSKFDFKTSKMSAKKVKIPSSKNLKMKTKDEL